MMSDDLIDECSSRELVEPYQRLEGLGLSASGTLIDPLFQDLDRNSRYYLAHCTCLVRAVTAVPQICLFFCFLFLSSLVAGRETNTNLNVSISRG